MFQGWLLQWKATGGGYYDRYLEHFTGHTLSPVYPCQIQDFIPENHDIPVQEVLIDEGNL